MLKNLIRRWTAHKRGNKERIICLVGESGSGKSTLAEAMEEFGYTQVPSYTTRAKRKPNERHHTFVTKLGFDQIRRDLVAHTCFNGYEYGATRAQMRKHHFYVVDPYGVEVLSSHLGRDNLLVIYLHVIPVYRLKRMMETRGREAAEERLEHDRKKFDAFVDYDVLLHNDYPDQLNRNIKVLLSITKGWYRSN